MRVRATRHAALAYYRRTGLWPHQAAGLRQVFQGRGFGRRRLAGLYDGEAAGMDTEAGRWQTVCEIHHHIISHETITIARSWVTHPDQWCEGCMDRQEYSAAV